MLSLTLRSSLLTFYLLAPSHSFLIQRALHVHGWRKFWATPFVVRSAWCRAFVVVLIFRCFRAELNHNQLWNYIYNSDTINLTEPFSYVHGELYNYCYNCQTYSELSAHICKVYQSGSYQSGFYQSSWSYNWETNDYTSFRKKWVPKETVNKRKQSAIKSTHILLRTKKQMKKQTNKERKRGMINGYACFKSDLAITFHYTEPPKRRSNAEKKSVHTETRMPSLLAISITLLW